MSILLVNKQDIRDINDDDFNISNVTMHMIQSERNLDHIARAHVIIVFDHENIKILKSRYPIPESNKIYPVSMLSYLMFRAVQYNSFTQEEDWILELCTTMNSKRLLKLSKQFEQLSFERA